MKPPIPRGCAVAGWLVSAVPVGAEDRRDSGSVHGIWSVGVGRRHPLDCTAIRDAAGLELSAHEVAEEQHRRLIDVLTGGETTTGLDPYLIEERRLVSQAHVCRRSAAAARQSSEQDQTEHTESHTPDRSALTSENTPR
jgi:hypothetical protein